MAKAYPQLLPNDMSVNCATQSENSQQKWLLDFTASHNITNDLINLSIHSEYNGTDEVILGDGTYLVVTHIN